jgi:hypothetical protein
MEEKEQMERDQREQEDDGGGNSVVGVGAAQLKPASMATYNAAVEIFSNCTTAFMEQLSHLGQARDAYEQAITASAELRKILDAGDQALRALMANLEQSIDFHLGRRALEKKKPEPAKIEPIGGNSEAAGVAQEMDDTLGSFRETKIA